MPVSLLLQIFSNFDTNSSPRPAPEFGEARSHDARPAADRGSPEGSQQIANVEIRPAELQVLVEAGGSALTVREFELFFLLAKRLDSVVQRPEIYELMWGGEMPRRDRSVDVLVRKVRGKLERLRRTGAISTPTSASATALRRKRFASEARRPDSARAPAPGRTRRLAPGPPRTEAPPSAASRIRPSR